MQGGREVQGLSICCPWFCSGILELITRLSFQQRQLCVLGPGKAPHGHHQRRHRGSPHRENTSGEKYFHQIEKYSRGNVFLRISFLSSFPFFIWANSYGRAPIFLEIPGMSLGCKPLGTKVNVACLLSELSWPVASKLCPEQRTQASQRSRLLWFKAREPTTVLSCCLRNLTMG